MQSMMTNAKAMQAMIKVQRGLEMLHAEAPGLVGRSVFIYFPTVAAFVSVADIQSVLRL